MAGEQRREHGGPSFTEDFTREPNDREFTRETTQRWPLWPRGLADVTAQKPREPLILVTTRTA